MTLQEEEHAFYAALGKAITQWQRVEEGLALIFSVVVSGIGRAHVSNAAFHAVINFESKLAMVNTALDMVEFTSTLQRPPGTESQRAIDWDPLRNRASRRAKRRNELAHFALHSDPTRQPGYRYLLRPNASNMRVWLYSGGEVPERNLCSLTAQGNSFQKLGMELLQFYMAHLAPHSEAPDPASAEPQI